MNIPKHLVIFPDGNGRWAKKNNLPRIFAYRKGYENLMDFCYWCKDRGVKVLTVYGFTMSTWSREKKLVGFFLKIFEKLLSHNIKKYLKDKKWQSLGVKVRVLGNTQMLPLSLQKLITQIEEATKDNDKLFLNLAISYSGRWDILNAVRNIVKDGVKAEEINEDLFSSYLSTAGLPDPDFIIRTGGDQRLSNFELWQLARAELYFTKKLWPEFTEQDLDQALADFDSRMQPLK